MYMNKVEQLKVLHGCMEDCKRCTLYKHRNNLVDFRGNPHAKVVLVGEGPGTKEDDKGIPFIGPSGSKVEKACVKLGIDTDKDTFIINSVRCHPRHNATPTTAQLSACKRWLLAQLCVVRPKLVITLGSPAGMVLSRNWRFKVTEQRGIIQEVQFISRIIDNPLQTKLLHTYHPMYVVRQHSEEVTAQWMKDLAVATEFLN